MDLSCLQIWHAKLRKFLNPSFLKSRKTPWIFHSSLTTCVHVTQVNAQLALPGKAPTSPPQNVLKTYIYIYVFVYIAPYIASRPIWCRCFGPVFLFFLLPTNSPSLFLVHVYPPPLTCFVVLVHFFFCFCSACKHAKRCTQTAVAENHGCTQPIL